MTRFTSSITHVVTIKTTGDLTNLSAIFEGHEHYTNKNKASDLTSFFLIYSVNNHLLALLLTNTYCSSKYYFGETGGKLCSRSRTGESNGAKGKGGGLDLSRAEWSA